MEKKINRVEKYNEQLRNKNSNLEKELLDKYEEREKEICNELNNLNVKTNDTFMNYIN